MIISMTQNVFTETINNHFLARVFFHFPECFSQSSTNRVNVYYCVLVTWFFKELYMLSLYVINVDLEGEQSGNFSINIQ